jgi:hypothetical protein
VIASRVRPLLLASVVCLAFLATACPSESTSSLVTPSAPTTPGGESTGEPAPSPTSSSEGPAVDLGISGKWSGSWANTTSNDATGTFTIEWVQSGSSLDGTISIKGTPCLDGGSISGEVHGATIEFGAVKGQVLVEYTGKIDGDSMSGTYETDCGNAEGTWEASKK